MWWVCNVCVTEGLEEKIYWRTGNAHTHMHKHTQIHMDTKTHKCKYKYIHPKGIFASLWLDAHLFRQSGKSSRILANNISSAQFSFCKGSSLFIFGFCFHSQELDAAVSLWMYLCCLQASVCTQVSLPEMWSKHTSGNALCSERERD